MPILHVSAPTPVPVDTDDRWSPMTHRVESWDGSSWDLTSGQSGVFLQAGVRGLTMPPMLRYKQQSPAVAGSFWRGSLSDERPVFWPLKVWNDFGSQEWIYHNRRFSRALLNPNATSRWYVTQPSGEVRWLDIRFEDDGQFAWGADDPDPELAGFAIYGYSFVAERPYWRGVPRQLLWKPEGAQGNFLEPEAGEVIRISSNNAVYGAQIANPSLLSAWPVWTIYGPCTLASVGVGSDTLTYPTTLTGGQFVTIYTDPTERMAVNQAGTDVTAALTIAGRGWAEIPPGEPVSLNVAMTGSGSVAVSITPNYYTATGH